MLNKLHEVYIISEVIMQMVKQKNVNMFYSQKAE